MKIFCLIMFFCFGAFGLYLDITNFFNMFGAFGVLMGLLIGLGKMALPILAYNNIGNDDNFVAVCCLLWCCAVVISGFNTAQYVKLTADEKLLLSPQHVAIQSRINELSNEMAELKETRRGTDNQVFRTAYENLGKEIQRLSDEKFKLETQYNRLTADDVTVDPFVKYENATGWIAAFGLEIFTVIFGVGARKEEENNALNKVEVLAKENKPQDNKDNTQILFIELLKNISEKLISMEQFNKNFALNYTSFNPINTSINDTSINDTSIRDISTNDTSINDTSINDTSIRDISTNDTSIRDISTNDTSIRDTSIRDTSTNVTSINDTGLEAVNTRDISIQDTSTIDISTHGISIEKQKSPIEMNTSSEVKNLSCKQLAVRDLILKGVVDNSWRNLKKYFAKEENKHLKLNQNEAKQMKDFMLAKKELVKNELHAGFALNPKLAFNACV